MLPERSPSAFQCIAQDECKLLTEKDDLTDFLVPLVDAVLSTSNGTSGAPPSSAAAATPSSSAFDTSAHLFRLLARYSPRVNRVREYLQLDLTGAWKETAQPTAATTAEAEPPQTAACTAFERGDAATRVRLVLAELRRIAWLLRHKPQQPTQSINASPTTTPSRPLPLSRAPSQSSAPSKVASIQAHPKPLVPYCSSLLTNSLFAEEIEIIMPALVLRCRAAVPSAQAQTDVEMTSFDEGSTPRSPTAASPSVAESESFMPLAELVHVLLHQGAFGARLLVLLAATRPTQLDALVDACFERMREHLIVLREKLHAMSLPLAHILHQPGQLAPAAHAIWQHTYQTVRAPPLTALFAFFNRIALLAPHIALFVRLRISKLMEEVRFIPPTILAPNASTAAFSPSQHLPAASSTPSTSTPSSATPQTSGQTTPARATRPNGSGLAAPASSGVRPTNGNGSALLNSLTVSSSAMPVASPVAVPAASYATPSFAVILLANCWLPLMHFLPSLALSLTLHAIQDEMSFLIGVFHRLNSSPARPSDATKTASHLLVEYIRDAKLSEEYVDVVQSAVNCANAAAAAAATAALHAHASKARAATSASQTPTEPDSNRKRKADGSRADRKHNKQSQKQQHSHQQAAGTLATPQQHSKGPSTPGTSPPLSATAAPTRLTPASQGTPSRPSATTGASTCFASPTLHAMQMRDLMMTPIRKGLAGSASTMSSPSIHGSPGGLERRSSTVSSTPSPFHTGSVEALRTRLLQHLTRLVRDFANSTESIDEGKDMVVVDTGEVPLLVLTDLTRLVRLYSYLLLYCHFSMRSAEFAQVRECLPGISDDRSYLYARDPDTGECVATRSVLLDDTLPITCDAANMHAAAQFLHALVTLVCITPHAFSIPLPSASTSTSMASRASTPQPHLSRDSHIGNSAMQWLPLFERIKNWYNLLTKELHEILASEADAKLPPGGTHYPSAVSNDPVNASAIVEDVLLQLGIGGHTQRSTELVPLLCALLRVPVDHSPHFKLERVQIHMREVQHLVATHLWSKHELLPRVMHFVEPCLSGASNLASIRSDLITTLDLAHGYFVFASPDPYTRGCVVQMITNVAHLLKPTIDHQSPSLQPQQPQSHQAPNSALTVSCITRPCFELYMSVWLKSMLLLVGEPHALMPTTDVQRHAHHPLMTHSCTLPMLDAVVQFDLSLALAEQQHLQPTSAVYHKPAQKQHHDGRVFTEATMAAMLQLLATMPMNDAQLPNKPACRATFHPVSQLPNPFGLALVVYYFLAYNALVLQIWSKAIPHSPSVPTPDEHVAPANSSTGQPTATAPLPAVGTKEGANQHAATYSKLGLPSPPFVTHVAEAVSRASAVQPYPPHLLHAIPLRGLMEFLKTALLSSPPTLQSNLSTLFFLLYRLLWKQYPETLIGFDLTGFDRAMLDVHSLQQTEGSLVTLGFASEQARGEHAQSVATLCSSVLHHLTRHIPTPQCVVTLMAVSAAKLGTSDPTSNIDAFLLYILGTLARRPDIVGDTEHPIETIVHNVASVWLRLYSASAVSSTHFVYRTLLAILDLSSPAPGTIEDLTTTWRRLESDLLFDDLLLDPLEALARLPPRVWSHAPLLRVVFACLYHLLVASASHLAVFARTEYISQQIVRQATYHASHTAWLNALRLMQPPPNNTATNAAPYHHAYHDRKIAATHAPVHIDPIAMSMQRPIESAVKHVFTGPFTTNAWLTATTVKKQYASTTEVEHDQPAKRAKTEEIKLAVPIADEEKAAEAATQSFNNESSHSASSSPRPFSFLLSDRLLSMAEQEVFSADFALAEHEPSDSKSGKTSPTIRAFAYLLTVRVCVVQTLLDRTCEVLRQSANGILAPSTATVTVEAICDFLRLLFVASSPASVGPYRAPSSLFLLLHVTAYPLELLPLMFDQFAPLMSVMIGEPAIVERLRAGPGTPSSKAQVSSSIFCRVLLIYAGTTKPEPESTPVYEAMQDRAALTAAWHETARLFPRAQPSIERALACLRLELS